MSDLGVCVQPVSATPLVVYRLAFGSQGLSRTLIERAEQSCSDNPEMREKSAPLGKY